MKKNNFTGTLNYGLSSGLKCGKRDGMTKMLFILPGLNGGGAERVVVNICQKLDKSKNEIKIALLKKEGPYLDLVPDYIKIIDLNISRVRYSFLKLIVLINNEKPDIVFSTLTHVNIVLCFLKMFIKIKIIIRECNIVSISLKGSLKKYFYKLFIPRADIIVAQSDDMAHDIVNNFNIGPTKIKKINNPVDFGFLEKKIHEPLDFSFENEKRLLIAVGRLEYQKGFDLLIDTFSRLPDKDRYQLIILGTGSMKEELEEQAQRQSVDRLVSFKGFVSNPYKYMAHADFFISSSRFEGFPNAVIEALACGTPVIANAYLGGINEIINENNGSIIDITNVSSFNDALLKQYNSQEIRNGCKDKYAIEKIIKEYEKLFDS
jgi:glycosyltransferase involved in cell wall biosynthesis